MEKLREKVKCLDGCQKGILIIMAVMVLVFTAMYAVTTSRKGFAYKDAILIPKQENGNTVYSGEIGREQAVFTVYADKTVEFEYGDKTYGPYTAREDPTAVPEDMEMEFGNENPVTGIELRRKDEIIFRGGVVMLGDYRWIFNEDGSMEDIGKMDFSGNLGNYVAEPSVSVILDLMAGPELTHKGEWYWWFVGAFFCILNAVSILFADELFRWHLSFQIRNTEQAEPSDWEMSNRYIGWIVMPVMALAVFIKGLGLS